MHGLGMNDRTGEGDESGRGDAKQGILHHGEILTR
jgi:hypothetical protein